MFGANIMMAHAAGFFDGKFQDLLGAGGKIDLAAAVLPKPAQLFNHFAHAIRFQAQFAQYTAGDAAIFLDQAEQQVFGPDRALVQALGFLMSQAEHPARSLGKSFHSRHEYPLL